MLINKRSVAMPDTIGDISQSARREGFSKKFEESS
jgi:hypothetical protein